MCLKQRREYDLLTNDITQALAKSIIKNKLLYIKKYYSNFLMLFWDNLKYV